MLWMGTRKYMRWVKAFASAPTYDTIGRSDFASYLNGGTGWTGSLASHREYGVSWPADDRDTMRAISDFKDGVYGDGNIEWLDPVAADKNALPQAWATPYLGCVDAQPLLREARPERIENYDLSLAYPAFMARYRPSSTSDVAKLWIPIPPGYRAWVGIHGDPASTGGVVVQPSGTGATIVPVVGVNSQTRFTHSFASTIDAGGIEISLQKSANATPLNTVIAGMMVQVLPAGSEPQDGSFISGQGHSGCRFENKLTQNPYQVAGPQYESVGMSARLVEVGQWV
jgi:hypothetical protein